MNQAGRKAQMNAAIKVTLPNNHLTDGYNNAKFKVRSQPLLL